MEPILIAIGVICILVMVLGALGECICSYQEAAERRGKNSFWEEVNDG
jgi:hypothetical protein